MLGIEKNFSLTYEQKEELFKKVSDFLINTDNISDIKKQTVELVGKTFNCDRCFIRLFDSSTDEFNLVDKHSEYLLNPEKVKSLVNYKFNTELDEMAIAAYKDGSCFIIPDIEEFVKHCDIEEVNNTLKEEFSIKSNYCCPIMKQDRLLGYFVIHYVEEKVFIPTEDIDFLRLIVKQILYILDSYLLRQREKSRELREVIFKNITAAIRSSIDINQARQKIVSELGYLLCADRCVINSFNPDTGKFEEIDSYAEYKPDDAYPSFVGIDVEKQKEFDFFKRLYLRWQEFILPDCNSYLESLPDEYISRQTKNDIKKLEIASNYAFPIIFKEKLYGYLYLTYKEHRKLNKEEIDFIRDVVSQIAIALSQARLYEKQKKLAEKEKLTRVIIDKIRSTLDLGEIKKAAVNELGKVISCDIAAFYIFDGENNVFEPVDEYSQYLASTQVKSLVGVDVEYYGWGDFFRKNLVDIIYSDIEEFIEEYDLIGTKNEKFIREFDIKSSVTVPISYYGELFGVLVVLYTGEKRDIPEEYIELVKTLANNAAIAFYQNSLYEKQKILAQQERFSREIINSIRSTIDINEMKKKIVTELGQTYEVDRCVIHQINPTTKKFMVIDEHSEYRSSPEYASFVGIDLEGKDQQYRFFTDLFKSDEGLMAPDWEEYLSKIDYSLVTQQTRELMKTLDIKSNYIFPVKYRGLLLGTVYFNFNKKKVSLSRDRFNDLQATINQVAVALYQSSLYVQEKQMRRSEKLKNQIHAYITENKNFEETLFFILNEIRAFFSCESACICKFDEQKTFSFLKTVCINTSHKLEKFLGNLDIQTFIYELNKQAYISDSCSVSPNKLLKNQPEREKVNNFLYNPVNVGDYKYGLLLANFDKDLNNIDFNLLQDISYQIESFIKESKIYNQKEFLSSVTHELKTPFTSVKGYAQLLKQVSYLEERDRRNLDSLINSVDRMDNIINNLAFLSYMETALDREKIDFNVINLKKLINNIVEIFSIRAGKKNIIIKENLDEVNTIANEELINQAVENLIDNAIKYSPKNSGIIVKLYVDNKQIYIEVADQGIGIPAKDKDKIFERFYRIYSDKTRYIEGSGIGLAIVKRVVEIHEGKVFVESDLDKGSRFIIKLPEIL